MIKFWAKNRESKFTKSWKIAAYIDSYANYEGQRDFYSKFGMMSNDEMTLVINPRLFAHQTDGGIPVLGDLIYFPMDNSLFEITWIEFNRSSSSAIVLNVKSTSLNLSILVKNWILNCNEMKGLTLLPMLIWISNLFEILMDWLIPILNSTKKIKPLKMKAMNSLNRLMLLTARIAVRTVPINIIRETLYM
ncbi:head completion [Klebsiella phage CPRSB]|nr:head completion [Klebsiella phage CPRSB]